MRRTFSIDIPTLAPADDENFDYRPGSVHTWVETLPMGNTGEATRQVFLTLHHANGIEIPLKHRFELMETLGSPLNTILDGLEERFRNQQFPLPEKARRIARLAGDLLGEILKSYKLILATPQPTSWLQRKSQRKMRVATAHRMLHYFARLMGIYRQLHMPLPRGLWHELHMIYLHAEQMGWNDDKVEWLLATDKRTTIEREYKKLLLTALLPLQHMRPEQRQQVEATLGVWAGAMELVDLDPEQEPDAPYCALLETDHPPIPVGERGRDLWVGEVHCKLLDTRELARLLDDLLATARAEGRARTPNGEELDAETLQHLQSGWVMPPSRGEERIAHNASVELALGLSGIHDILESEQARAAGEPEKSELELVSEETVRGFGFHEPGEADAELESPKLAPKKGEFVASVEDADRDMWESVYSATGRTHTTKAWNEDTTAEYRAVEARILDTSANGYRLSLPIQQIEQLKTGDMVGIRDPRREGWRVGSVRWLRHEREKEVQIGVHTLVANILPVTVRIKIADGESPAIRALVGYYAGSTPILVVPLLPSIHKKPLMIRYGDVDADIKLTERVSDSPVFEVYKLAVMRVVRQRPATGQGDALLELLHDILPQDFKEQAPDPEPKPEDEYANLWENL